MYDCLKKCSTLRGREAGLSPFMLSRTFYKGFLAFLNYYIEKVEMQSHMYLVSLWSQIKALWFLHCLLLTQDLSYQVLRIL